MSDDPNIQDNTSGINEQELEEFNQLAQAGVQEVAMSDRRVRMAALADIRKANDAANRKNTKRGTNTHRAVFSKGLHRDC